MSKRFSVLGVPVAIGLCLAEQDVLTTSVCVRALRPRVWRLAGPALYVYIRILWNISPHAVHAEVSDQRGHYAVVINL